MKMFVRDTESRRRKIEGRFLDRAIKQGECWVWTGCVLSNGQLRFRSDGVYEEATSYSLRTYRAALPPGHYVKQTCGNCLCVNPLHLEARPETEYLRRRLTEADVRVIRARIAAGENDYRISRDFPVGSKSIYDIRHGKQWRGV